MKKAAYIPWIALVAVMALSLTSENIAQGQTTNEDDWTIKSPYASSQRQSRVVKLPYIGPSLSTRRSSSPSRAPRFAGKTFDYDFNTSHIVVLPYTNDQVSTLSERHAWFMPGSNLLRSTQQNNTLDGTGDTTDTANNLGGGIIGGLFDLDTEEGENSSPYQWAVRSDKTADSATDKAQTPVRASRGQIPARQWRPPSVRRILLPYGGEVKKNEYEFGF